LDRIELQFVVNLYDGIDGSMRKYDIPVAEAKSQCRQQLIRDCEATFPTLCITTSARMLAGSNNDEAPLYNSME
jgi:hypothetical protein